MNKIIPKLPNIELCTGCKVCEEVCKFKAISFSMDNHGFYYPIINNQKCKGCLKCENICPIIQKPDSFKEISIARVGTHRNFDILYNSSSGGAFAGLVEVWNPDIVCGVRWDGFKVINDITTKNNYELFSKSKYIFSDTNGIFEKTKKEIIRRFYFQVLHVKLQL